MAVYHLVLHTVAAITTLATLPPHRSSFFIIGYIISKDFILENRSSYLVSVTTFSITAVGCGWTAFHMFFFHILRFESDN